METINIIIVLQGLFWALLILSSRLRTIEKASLSLIMISCVFIQLADLIPNERSTFLLPITLKISLSFVFLSVCSLYVSQSIRQNESNKPLRNHLIIVPLIIAFLNPLIKFSYHLPKYSVLIISIYFVIFFYVFIINGIKLLRYARRMEYSSHLFEDTNLYISSLLLTFTGIIISLLVTISILGLSNESGLPGGNSLWINLTIAGGMFVIGYLSITKELQTEKKPTIKNINKTISIENPDKQKRIEDAFKIDKIHLDNDLTIDKLAFHLSMDTTELSSILNHEMKTNFYQLINSYRVEEVKKKLREDDQRFFTLLAIAFDCGFNSKSTFNRVFKEFTGKSPKDFKDGVKK